jgi:hypothetical protein
MHSKRKAKKHEHALEDAPSHCPPCSIVVSRLDMYHTKVLLYRMMVLMARLTKVRR